LDVVDGTTINTPIAAVEHTLGPIDVLVNNVGYKHRGTIEESSLADVRQQFEVNVFGAVAVMRAVLPFMRARRAGDIITLGPVCTAKTAPGLGIYLGSKLAVKGITDALRKEVAPFGIRVTMVEAGAFRAEYQGRSCVHSPRTVTDYDAVLTPPADVEAVD